MSFQVIPRIPKITIPPVKLFDKLFSIDDYFDKIINPHLFQGILLYRDMLFIIGYKGSQYQVVVDILSSSGFVEVTIPGQLADGSVDGCGVNGVRNNDITVYTKSGSTRYIYVVKPDGTYEFLYSFSVANLPPYGNYEEGDSLLDSENMIPILYNGALLGPVTSKGSETTTYYTYNICSDTSCTCYVARFTESGYANVYSHSCSSSPRYTWFITDGTKTYTSADWYVLEWFVIPDEVTTTTVPKSTLEIGDNISFNMYWDFTLLKTQNLLIQATPYTSVVYKGFNLPSPSDILKYFVDLDKGYIYMYYAGAVWRGEL